MDEFISAYPSTAFDNAMSIQDNLTSTDINKPLSANQGRVLNEKIDSIIESDSNANGSYVKYADGRLKCKHRITTSAGATANNNGFISPIFEWTFPVAFINPPDVFGFPRKIVVQGANPMCVSRPASSDITTTSTGNALAVWYNQASAVVKTEVSLEADGRWK